MSTRANDVRYSSTFYTWEFSCSDHTTEPTCTGSRDSLQIFDQTLSQLTLQEEVMPLFRLPHSLVLLRSPFLSGLVYFLVRYTYLYFMYFIPHIIWQSSFGTTTIYSSLTLQAHDVLQHIKPSYVVLPPLMDRCTSFYRPIYR